MFFSPVHAIVSMAKRRAAGAPRPEEGFEHSAAGAQTWGDVYAELIASLVVWLIVFVIAVAVAVSCNAGFRDYVVVFLDPWVYLMIRLVVRCGAAAQQVAAVAPGLLIDVGRARF